MTLSPPNTPRLVAAISGCMKWPAIHSSDTRGTFSKVLSAPIRSAMGYDFHVREIFWNRSREGVIRGMHLQLPPHEGAKVIWVTAGKVRDVVIDLRVSSPTYRQHVAFEMDNTSGLLFIPVGCANGFEVLSSEAVVNYAQECDYAPDSDSGVRWDSFGCQWNSLSPVVSARDSELPPLETFDSPFS
ncbi:MAG: dTDP-4-dehydrorhamnose 3,5-epimerase family protein [Ilumatobacteraceae bacterium]